MSLKGKIISIILFTCLTMVLITIGVWAVPNIDFTISGDLEYVAPEIEYPTPEEISYLTFNYYDDLTAELTGASGTLPDLIEIPPYINKDGEIYTVTKIAPGEMGASEGTPIFYGADTLIIPDTVIEIGEYAFVETSFGTVVVGSGVKSMGDSFVWANIGTVEFKEGLKEIPQGVFSDATVHNIVIPNTVESIASWAFNWCYGITNIQIPDSVTSIGDYVFGNCDSLTSIEIPNSVISIGDDAFRYCSSLASVIIGNSVTSIGSSAFSSCDSLTSIEIPNSVTSIGSNAFGSCNGLTAIIVDKNNSVYDSRDNCNALIETSSNTLIVGCKNTIIPNTIKSIGVVAFGGIGLASIEIPNSVTSIGSGAFADCSGLTSVTIPNSVIRIDGNAFDGCSNLKNMNYLGALKDWASISFGTRYSNPTYYTKKLVVQGNEVTSISSLDLDGVTSISQYAFYNCTGLTSVTMSDSVESIGTYAFAYCSGLTGELVIPASVTSIGEWAFAYCSGLASVIIGNRVTSISQYAFYNCTGLASVIIGNSVTSISEFAFADCTGLTNITIPNSVTSIADYAFSHCDKLTDVYYTGSETEWNSISIGNTNNIQLKEATRHYNYVV